MKLIKYFRSFYNDYYAPFKRNIWEEDISRQSCHKALLTNDFASPCSIGVEVHPSKLS